MSENKAAANTGFSARVEIGWPKGLIYNSKRYARASMPAIDLPRTLGHLRALDFAAPDVQAAAARLLDTCGYAPAGDDDTSTGRRAGRWASEHIDAGVLDSLASIQKAAVAFERHKAEEAALNYRRAARGAKGRVPSVRDVETAIVTYLKQQRRDVPEKQNAGTYLSELFGALADFARESGEPVVRVLQRIAPGPIQHELKKSASAPPGEVLMHLLNVCAANGRIETLVHFDSDGLPVVRIAPRDAVGALLLRMHEAMALPQQSWVTCAWCGEAFPQKRRDQTTCKETCRNSLKKQRQRARQRAQQKQTTERRANNHA